jgi:diacylglycerol O-acyltransferase / wax synthase
VSEMRFEHRMSDADALMWTIEKDPLLRSTITTVAVFDTAPDRARLTEAIDRTTRVVPRLRQRVVSNPLSIAPPRWEVDPNFDLSFHLRWLRAGGEGSLRDVLDLAEPIAMQGFDRARPLWEAAVVEGLEDGRTAMVLKLHHAITDGVGGIKIAMHLFDLDREGVDRSEMPDEPPVHVLNRLQRIADAVDHERRRQLGIVKRSIGTVARAAASAAASPATSARRAAETAASVGRLLAPATEPLSDVMTARSLSVRFDVLRYPLADLKAAAKKAGGRLNDAFVAGVAGGFRRYHLRHGSSVRSLRMTMPINIRNDQTADLAGNQFAPARFAVPIDIDDPVARMEAIHELAGQARGEPALNLAEPLAAVLYRLPATLSTGVFGAMLRGVDFVTSNVPGVPVPVFLAGARMEAQFPFGPMTGAATNITLLSYLDEVQIGVNTDPAAIPDGDVFLTCLDEGFAEVLKV